MNATSCVPSIQVETIPWSGHLPKVDGALFPRLNAHFAPWISAVSNGLRHNSHLIIASYADQQAGVLPLTLVSGPIFGKFLVSIPYVNTGGVWAENEAVAQKLISAACDLADDLSVDYLELRHEVPIQHSKFTFERTDKVHMRLPLPESSDKLLKSFKSKVRSQIKKSLSCALSVEFGGQNLLSDFYHVFSRNMRDLGTPVFSKKLFLSILDEFPSNAELCVVRKNKQTAAAALLVHNNFITEVPSASCIRKFNRWNANMFMYWQLLQRAIDKKCHTFDFGRSSIDSGTHKFKAQWGAEAQPAVWQYYVRKGNPAKMRADYSSKKKLVQIWQKLPVWLTNLVGPCIVRGIP